MDEYVEKANEAIAAAIDDLCHDLKFASDERRPAIVKQIAELRASMNPITIVQK